MKFTMNAGRYAEMNGLVNKIATTMMDKRQWKGYLSPRPGSKKIKTLRDHATFDESVNFMHAQRVVERKLHAQAHEPPFVYAGASQAL